MTKDDANAIMFAYRYDNLTISESLFKQMIGDIAIMRNPWPIFSIAALSGAACLIYDHFFSYETMWIAVVVFLGHSASIPKTSLQRTGSPLCWNNSAGQKRKKLWSSFCIEQKIRRINWGITYFVKITQGRSETLN